MINVEHALDVVALAHHEVRVGVVQSVELVLERLLLLADLVQRRVVAAELVDAQLVFLADLGDKRVSYMVVLLPPQKEACSPRYARTSASTSCC